MVDLAAEFSEGKPLTKIAYMDMPVLDLTAHTQAQLHMAVEFIAEQHRRGTVFVHCKIGYSRSAAVVGAYLLASGQAHSADDALDMLRAARQRIVIRPEARRAIENFAQTLSRPSAGELVPA